MYCVFALIRHIEYKKILVYLDLLNIFVSLQQDFYILYVTRSVPTKLLVNPKTKTWKGSDR